MLDSVWETPLETCLREGERRRGEGEAAETREGGEELRQMVS